MRVTAGLVAMALLLVAGRAAWAQGGVPDSGSTPGALNPDVTQENIGETICVRGWTRTIRPPEAHTEDLKQRQIREYGYADQRLGHYEVDYLWALDIGGSPTDPRNLWPEPWRTADGWGADRKDELEYALNRLVCSDRVPLAEAQQAMAVDWVAAYRRHISSGE
jgi:hypothetical protein